MNWHLDAASARSYADGTLAGARAASVEAHVLSCADCRRLITPDVPVERLAAIWSEVEERVDTPRGTWAERFLTRCGMSGEDARLLSAAPSLQLSWLVSLAVVMAFAAAAANSGERGTVLFLVLAPLAPVAGVAGAYGQGIDPTYEVTRSTPYPVMRLLLLRVSAVLVTSLLITAVLALVMTDGWVTAAWLLPAVALAGVTLALSRWYDLTVSAVAVVIAYSGLIATFAVSDQTVRGLFAGPGQLIALLLAVACALFLMTTTPRYASVRSKR